MNEEKNAHSLEVQCPKCKWQPTAEAEWHCINCQLEWNMFDTAARCPRCDHQHDITYCIEWLGGCGENSPHLDWYPGIDDALNEINIKKLLH